MDERYYHGQVIDILDRFHKDRVRTLKYMTLLLKNRKIFCNYLRKLKYLIVYLQNFSKTYIYHLLETFISVVKCAFL